MYILYYIILYIYIRCVHFVVASVFDNLNILYCRGNQMGIAQQINHQVQVWKIAREK